MRRPKAVVFDILGTASKSGFLERILFPFLKANMEPYISAHWNKHVFKKLYQRLVEESTEFNKRDSNAPIVFEHSSPQARSSLMNYINYITENGIMSRVVTHLRFQIWFEGYQHSKIRTPIYRDVPNRVRVWFAEGIRFYVFSNTWVEAQKALLRNTNHGDLTNLISGHYDNDFGPILEPNTWRRLCAELGQSPNEVLFLTKSPMEGRAAREAGVNVVLVLTHRHNVKAISQEDREIFPFVRTLNDLSWLEGSMMPAATGVIEPTPTAVTGTGSDAASGASSAAAASSTRTHHGSSSHRPSSSSRPPSSQRPSSSGTQQTSRE